MNGWKAGQKGGYSSSQLGWPSSDGAEFTPEKRWNDPDLLQVLDIWFESRHQSELARAQLRAGRAPAVICVPGISGFHQSLPG